MQICVIEFARDVLKLKEANSREFFQDCPDPVIDLMENQKGVSVGGTMRLGKYPCKVKPDSIMYRAYGCSDKNSIIEERHRHRYEFNNNYRQKMESAGLIISGTSPDNTIVETVELPESEHKFFVGVQFHPEFTSRPNNPGPLFVEFVRASV